jgi:hypothetical protein
LFDNFLWTSGAFACQKQEEYCSINPTVHQPAIEDRASNKKQARVKNQEDRASNKKQARVKNQATMRMQMSSAWYQASS